MELNKNLAHKELIILNIFKYKINIALMSGDMSCDHFATILSNNIFIDKKLILFLMGWRKEIEW